jgi:hypothetical protein
MHGFFRKSGGKLLIPALPQIRETFPAEKSAITGALTGRPPSIDPLMYQ